MRKKVAGSLAAALIISATAAFGAVKEKSFTVTPLVGGYVFDDDQNLDSTLIVGIRGGYNFTKYFGIEALYDYGARTDASSGPLTGITLHRFGGQALYHFFPDNIFVPYVAAGFSGLKFEGDGVGHSTHGAFDYGVGAKYFLTDDFALRGDVRHILYKANSDTMNNVEFTLGAYVQFGAVAPVVKTIALEPTPVAKAIAPEPVPVAPPPAPVTLARLSVAPAGITKGESATLSWNSQNASKCNIQPTVGSVPPQGTVSVTPAGNTTYQLTCVGESGTVTKSANVAVTVPPPPVASAELSVAPSRIIKGESTMLSWASKNTSKCDIQPTVGSVPPQGSVRVTPADNATFVLVCTGDGGVITKSADVTVTVPPPVKAPVAKLCSPAVIDIQFDTNKADIKPQYHNELKQLSDFLTEFPNAKGVIEGHTDNVGDKASNMKLSQRRADSVRNYIIKTFGVTPERLTAKGYGPTKPIADNKTKEGKAQNRRIEANFSCE